MAVVFAMLTSYFLSRTLVPTMVRFLLRARRRTHHGDGATAPQTLVGALLRRASSAASTACARATAAGSRWALAAPRRRRRRVRSRFVVGVARASSRSSGDDFFPSVDAGLIKLHVRGAPGTRIEETEQRFADDRGHDPHASSRRTRSRRCSTTSASPYSGINLSLSEGALISPADGEILIALKEDHAPTADYVRKLRDDARARRIPDTTFFFLAPDISTQVLNFGLAAPIDVQVVGADRQRGRRPTASRSELAEQVAADPRRGRRAPRAGARAARAHASTSTARWPSQVGLTERDVASDLLVSLSSSAQVAPSYWLDKRGVQYLVAVQTPQYEIDSIDALRHDADLDRRRRRRSSSPTSRRSRAPTGPANITHYNVARTYDVQANVDGTDLGSVADAVDAIVDEHAAATAPRHDGRASRARSRAWTSSFRGLGYGLVFAVVLVYLLMVVNFQSWLDPFIILMALPGRARRHRLDALPHRTRRSACRR